MSVLKQHISLQIIKGAFKAPGDENSAEKDQERIDLLDETGLTIETNGWTPVVASLKGGGVWADSNISTGRRLLSATDGNVTETMRLILGNRDLSQRHAILKRLNRIIQDCRDFWQTEWQIDPVYLAWYSAIGAGEQYALIYNIELDYQLDSFMLDNPWGLTLTIEREPYWRGLPPGMNPKEWTLGVFSGRPRGNGYTIDDLKLYEDDNHLWIEVIDNKQEWNPADYYNPIGKNWIEIPAERIPGDAPALVQIDFDHTGDNADMTVDLYIARWTKPTAAVSHQNPSLQRGVASMWNAADGNLSSGGVTRVSSVAEVGVIANGTLGTYYYVNIDFSTNPGVLDFGNNFSNLYSHFDMNLMRGTYAVFLRHSQTAGTEGDIDLQLDLYAVQNTANLSTSYATLNLVATLGLTGIAWTYGYFGTLTIPPGSRSFNSPAGYGLEMFPQNVAGDEHNLKLRLTATRNTGSAQLNVVDLVMLPLDEACIHIVNPNTNYSPLQSHILYDNTGYVAHGEPDGVAMLYMDEAASAGLFAPVDLEVRGPELHLMPGVDNRLYFFGADEVASGNSSKPWEDEFTVRVNIIPRWRGIRDQ